MLRYWAAWSMPLSLIAKVCALSQGGERPPAASAKALAPPMPAAASAPRALMDTGLALVPTASVELFHRRDGA